MKRAVVDIGTNSTRLLIAETGNKIKRLEKHTIVTRLGKGVDRYRKLGDEGIKRNVDVLLEYKKIAQSYGVEQIHIIATSAVRDAGNRDEFTKIVKELTGLDVDVISGQEEARLGFLGASSVINGGPGTVCDIGGGSTELIHGRYGEIMGMESVDVGAVRMTERFLNPDVISEEEINAADNFIREIMKPVAAQIKKSGKFSLAGIGGTITTLAAIDQGLSVYDYRKVHGYVLGKDKVDSMFHMLARTPLEQRVNIPGLQKERADIISAGTLILKIVLEELGSGSIIVSEDDNLEGYLLDI